MLVTCRANTAWTTPRDTRTTKQKKEISKMDITRRKFRGMFGAATAICSTTAFAFAVDNEFLEFEPHAMYFHYANGL